LGNANTIITVKDALDAITEVEMKWGNYIPMYTTNPSSRSSVPKCFEDIARWADFEDSIKELEEIQKVFMDSTGIPPQYLAGGASLDLS
jgi:hypothetical protein